MALFRGIQEYIALDANNITLVFDSGNIVNISGNIFLYPPQGHPILYKYSASNKFHGLLIRDVSGHLPILRIINSMKNCCRKQNCKYKAIEFSSNRKIKGILA